MITVAECLGSITNLFDLGIGAQFVEPGCIWPVYQVSGFGYTAPDGSSQVEAFMVGECGLGRDGHFGVASYHLLHATPGTLVYFGHGEYPPIPPYGQRVKWTKLAYRYEYDEDFRNHDDDGTSTT